MKDQFEIAELILDFQRDKGLSEDNSKYHALRHRGDLNFPLPELLEENLLKVIWDQMSLSILKDVYKEIKSDDLGKHTYKDNRVYTTGITPEEPPQFHPLQPNEIKYNDKLAVFKYDYKVTTKTIASTHELEVRLDFWYVLENK